MLRCPCWCNWREKFSTWNWTQTRSTRCCTCWSERQNFFCKGEPKLLSPKANHFLILYLNPDFILIFNLASNAARAVACSATSRRRRTTSIPASWLAQESFLNQEVTTNNSIAYNRLEFTPIRPVRNVFHCFQVNCLIFTSMIITL